MNPAQPRFPAPATPIGTAEASRQALRLELDDVTSIGGDVTALLSVIGDCPLLPHAIRDRAELHAIETRAQQALLRLHRAHLRTAAPRPDLATGPAERCAPLYARSGNWLLARWLQLEQLEIQAYQRLVASTAHTDLPDLLSGCASALDLQRSLLQWLLPLVEADVEHAAHRLVMQGAANVLQESPGVVHP